MNTDPIYKSATLPSSPSSTDFGSRADQSTAGKSNSSYQEVKDTAGEQIRQVASDLKESGGEALHSAKEAGSEFITSQKEKLATQIDRYTEAMNSACDRLDSGEANPLVRPAQCASRQMVKAANYLRNHDTRDFFNDLGLLAKRRPELVYGGLFVAGLAAVRFLKASAREQRDLEYRSSFRPSGLPYQPAAEAAPYPTYASQPIS